MKKIPEPPSISNLALGGVAALFVVTVGVLGGLYYNLRPHKAPVAIVPVESMSVPVVQVSSTPARDSIADENAPVIRLAVRAEETLPVMEPKVVAEIPAATPEKLASVETVAPATESASLEEALRANSSPLATASAKDNDLLIPEMKGPSYTAKKAAANGGDAYAGTKPGGNGPSKKPEVKKVIPPLPPVPPKAPVKPDVPKPTGLPAAEIGKLDFSKASVYVLRDGRRIKAIVLKDDGTTLTVRNEVGTAISFKKTDVKEIIRS
jgi:hypothetical protein